ncbi:hypothetical protein PAUR_a1191 [Pseudoalteromonas aurantia 208]|uniref:Orphan protein n=1 Tax=Pseudoalteromonas aurantia 208 TaxID=1314867 RepID=A0ABR9EBL5_9GAMM|nr:hypothetical protein [Pseudoalteromonas aurantia 208]
MLNINELIESSLAMKLIKACYVYLYESQLFVNWKIYDGSDLKLG